MFQKQYRMAEVIPRRPCIDNNCGYGNSSSIRSLAAQSRQEQGSSRAKWRAYLKRRIRRKSFDGAAVNLVQQANHFAKLGFFYKGYGKQIICFQCGLEVEVKEGVHDYHTEHSTRAPQCPFVCQLNEHGQSDESDSEYDVLQSNYQNTDTTRDTANGIYDRDQSIAPPRLDASYTYVYDSEDPMNSPNNHNISQDRINSLSRNQDISNIQNQDVSLSRNHDSSRYPQHKDTWDDQLACKVCLSEQVSVTFRPCGHLATCRACANRLQKCPVCRAFIREKINTYLS